MYLYTIYLYDTVYIIYNRIYIISIYNKHIKYAKRNFSNIKNFNGVIVTSVILKGR